MRGTGASGYITAAIFLAIVAIGVAYDSRTIDLLLALAWLPLIGFLAIHKFRQRRRSKGAAENGDAKPADLSERVSRWFYGGL